MAPSVRGKRHRRDTGLSVRVVERRFPGIRDLQEIKNKWLYVFHQDAPGGDPKLLHEIFAPIDKRGRPLPWLSLRQKGQGKDPGKTGAARKYGAGRVRCRTRNGWYLFFLSPVQIGPETLGALQNEIKQDASRPRASWMPLDNTGYWFDLNGKEAVPDNVVNWHKFPSGQIPSRFIVAVPDPFTWAEDLQALDYQGALELLRTFQHDQKRTSEVMVAQAFRGVMAKGPAGEDPKKVARHLKDPLLWQGMRGRSRRPSRSRTRRLPDGRSLTHSARVSVKQWDRVRVGAKTSADVRVNIHQLELKAHRLLASRAARRLIRWLEGRRHKIVVQACLELYDKRKQYQNPAGPDMVAYLIVHWAKVSCNLGEVEAGQQFQLRQYGKDAKSVIRMLLDQAKLSPGAWWAKQGPLRDVAMSTLKLVENFANAISVSEGKQFEPFMKRVLGMKLLGLRLEPPDPKLFPMLFGKPIPTSLHAPMVEIPKGTRLADAKKFFDRYQVDSWFAGIGITVSTINVALAINKIMAGKAKGMDSLKAGLDSMALIADVAKLSLEIPLKSAKSFAAMARIEEQAVTKGLSKAGVAALTRVGAAAAAGGGLIDFHTAVDAGNREAFMNENPEAAVGHALKAVGAGVGFGVSAFGIVFGGLVSGPLGWIALAAAGLSILGSWLASYFTRTQWGDVALFCYLGRRAGQGRVYKAFFEGLSKDFEKNYDAQTRAISGLMAASVVKLAWGSTGRLRVYPGFVDSRTKYRIFWQLGYRSVQSSLPSKWVEIVAELKPKEGVLKIRSVRRTNLTTAEFAVLSSCSIENVKLANGRCSQFDVFPKITTGLKSVIPTRAVVAMQIDVFDDKAVLVPLDSTKKFTYKLPDGRDWPLTQYDGVVADTVRPEQMEVS